MKIFKGCVGAFTMYATLCIADSSPATWQSVVLVAVLSIIGSYVLLECDK